MIFSEKCFRGNENEIYAREHALNFVSQQCAFEDEKLSIWQDALRFFADEF